MSDSFVQLPTDGAGKQIDTQALTNANSQTVHRQTITVGDPNNIGNVASVASGGLTVNPTGQNQDGTYVPAAVDSTGRRLISPLTPISLDQAVDRPINVTLTGDPEGDLGGINVIEKLLDTQGDLGLNTRVMNQPRQDATGALMISDAPQLVQWYNGNIGPGPIIDTQGYESIVVSFAGSSGTYLFQTSNDVGTFTASLANAAGWSSAGASVVITSVSAAAGTNYVIPVSGRYFRLYCSTAGTAAMTTIALRTAPSIMPASTLNVGGNIAVGSAPSGNPVSFAGWDYSGLTRRGLMDSLGNFQVVGGLASGYQVNTYNVKYSGYTSVLSSQTTAQSNPTPVLNAGVDGTQTVRPILTDQTGAVSVTSAPATPSQLSIQDLLQQILAALRVIAHYEYNNISQSTGYTAGDEPDTLMAEYMNPSNSFINLIN